MSQGDREPASWASMSAPARALSVLSVVALVSVFTLAAALLVGGLTWLAQAVWSAVLS